jgi:hypothetical protein
VTNKEKSKKISEVGLALLWSHALPVEIHFTEDLAIGYPFYCSGSNHGLFSSFYIAPKTFSPSVHFFLDGGKQTAI